MAPARKSSSSEATGAGNDVEAGRPKAGITNGGKPSESLTWRQIFYIFGMHGVGAMLLSGAINFLISYGMYTTQDTARKPIRLFELPNTLAGDAAVTIIIQCIVTWLIELALVGRDLKTGAVQAIGIFREPSGRIARWFFFLSDEEADSPRSSAAFWLGFMVNQILRGFIFAVASFLLLWGPSVGILAAVGERSGGDYVYPKQWTPQIFKGVLGGVLGLLTTPAMAAFWLLRSGWIARRAMPQGQ